LQGISRKTGVDRERGTKESRDVFGTLEQMPLFNVYTAERPLFQSGNWTKDFI
jgi:hypothetical protein